MYDTRVFPISHLRESLIDVLSGFFRLDPAMLDQQFSRYLRDWFEQLRDDLYVCIEAPYVDRVYRDSYYMYYASKYGFYDRDCVKVSFFSTAISETDFRSAEGYGRLTNHYLGFCVLRPTEPNFIGRNVIHPDTFKQNRSFSYCSALFRSSANCLRFSVEGFPHSSQDGETYSCAETTLWSLMEYFGHKYEEYSPVKPSQIHRVLRSLAYERQIPSRGLTIPQISFVLKSFGLECRIYSKEEYGDDFFALMSCYLSSGVPLVVGMDDFNSSTGHQIGHALLAIGLSYPSAPKHNGITAPHQLIDLDASVSELVFIDDNFPPYQIANINKPTAHYQPDWAQVEIKHFVAPLFPKIYLEAYEAKSFLKAFLLQGPKPLLFSESICFRLIQTSSGLLKHHLALGSITDDLKTLLLSRPMPKYIWLAEWAPVSSFGSGLRTGLVILDATEPNVVDVKPLIVACFDGSMLFFDGSLQVLSQLSLPLPPFNSLINALALPVYERKTF